LRAYRGYSCKIMSAEKITSVPAAEVEERFDYYRDKAANEPILILENGRPETVLLSYEEFVRLRGRQAYGIDDLPAHLVTAILEAKVPDELDEAKL
jgi:Antitoxin Phd_YefM, type II toxin-antitoxin system